jgi:hypothetical protein
MAATDVRPRRGRPAVPGDRTSTSTALTRPGLATPVVRRLPPFVRVDDPTSPAAPRVRQPSAARDARSARPAAPLVAPISDEV